MGVFTLIILRIVHIFAGVFWVGIVFMVTRFLGPNAKVLGPDASKFMQRLMGPMRLLDVALTSAFLTVLSGICLIWIFSDGFQMEWMSSATGITLLFGGICALVTFFIGLGVTKPSFKQLQALGRDIGASGEPPSSEQQAEMAAIQARMGKAGNIAFILLVIAVLTMSVGRYMPMF